VVRPPDAPDAARASADDRVRGPLSPSFARDFAAICEKYSPDQKIFLVHRRRYATNYFVTTHPSL
jgi:hypothetical protein